MLFECKVPAWFLILCSVAMAWFVLGCEGVREQVPNFGSQDAEFHAGRDIEREQGITRDAEGWIKSDGARYRIVGGRCEWSVDVANITDMPRRASCSVVASFDNPAVGAETCLAAEGSGSIIIPPRSASQITGWMPAPNSRIRAFSRRVVQPAPAPQSSGAVVVRCVAVKDGVATIEWKATAIAAEHQIAASYGFPNGKRVQTTKELTVKDCILTVVLYGQDCKTEICRDTARVVADHERRLSACQRIEVAVEKAADIGLVTVQWDVVRNEASIPAVKTKRMRVTAYCPCARCCGRMSGLTADGSNAWRPGVATDWRYWPAGTRFSIPGYGRVAIVSSDDTGRLVRGPQAIDVRMTYHWQARAWGVRWVDVEILEG